MVDISEYKGQSIKHNDGLENKVESYSPKLIKSYDRERHIATSDAFDLLGMHNTHEIAKLIAARDSGKIHIYNFKGEEYLDRLDIGRVFHEQRKKEGLTIERYFTDGKTNPFDTVGPYGRRKLEIKEFKTGELIFQMDDAEFPESWDNVHAQIVAQKYFSKPNKEQWKKKLKEKIGNDHEYSIKNLITRVTNFIADEGYKLGYFETEEDKKAFADELKFLQISRRFAFNSPVQFNAGLYNEYGIEGSPGINYFKNPETGEVSKIENGCNIKPQSHACFIKGPRDNLESILKHIIDEGGIFSSGSGIGQEIGALRAQGEPLSSGGKSSGPMSFFQIYDRAAGSIKSGGKSRRAARMTTMRVQHPDSLDFIRSKVKEDKKCLTLMQAGYSTGMDGEAAATTAFQNTNISVRVDDSFMEQVKNNGEIELKRIIDGKVVKKESARKILQEISFGSWRVGDPAIQYETKIQEMHTCKNSGRINSSNPCSEYMFLDDTSCNLGSHNLLEYSDEKGNFKVDEFRRAIYLTTIAHDILNDASSYPVEDIARISPEFRTIGIGYANLGALLMRKGFAYDSEEGRAVASAITALMTGTAYEASSDLAEKLGHFTHFEFNKKPMLDVMEKHRKNLDDILWKYVSEDLKSASYESWKNVLKKGRANGFRNAQATVLAPTGTISYLMGCDTTGVEPSISLIIYKNLAGGGTLKLVNKEFTNALRNLGYTDENIKDISDYVKEEIAKDIPRGTVTGAPHLRPEHYRIFDTAIGNVNGQGCIPFEGHIRMLGATQPFVSGAISKTNNLPESASVKDIYDGYLLAHELGLKAVAVFRNNSKPTAALGFGDKSVKKLERGEKEDLPARRNASEFEVAIGGTQVHVLVSEYEDGRPGQITFLSHKAGSTLGALLSTSGIQASKSLKRGVHLEDIIEGWIGQEFEPKGLVSGHPHIKLCLSPLDFAGKLLRLEYLGDLDVSNVDKKDIKIEDLRGAKNGAFRTYERMKVDPWNFEQVMKDPEYGGFVKPDDSKKILSIQNNGSLSKNNVRGVLCRTCGNIMGQTAPNCYECKNCGDKVGGCGI